MRCCSSRLLTLNSNDSVMISLDSIASGKSFSRNDVKELELSNFSWRIEPSRIQVYRRADGEPYSLGSGGYGTVRPLCLAPGAMRVIPEDPHGRTLMQHLLLEKCQCCIDICQRCYDCLLLCKASREHPCCIEARQCKALQGGCEPTPAAVCAELFCKRCLA